MTYPALLVLQLLGKAHHFETLLLLVSILTIVIAGILSMIPMSLALSPPFGHEEMRDERSDLINTKECTKPSADRANNLCLSTVREGNQSIDIMAIDYFSDGNTLNSTLWLKSKFKKTPLYYQDIPSYGAYIDADSNIKTGWQGIDYQLEYIWNNGTWNKTLYQFSTIGPNRILSQENLTGGKIYKNDSNYFLMNLDLTAIGYPDKYKIMFYAEDRKRDNSVWKTDFSSWIDIPKPELVLSTTPSTIELRPKNREIIGIQLTSKDGLIQEVSSFVVNDLPANISLEPVDNKQGNISQPIAFEIQIPEKISPGKYNLLMLANVTQKSTIPKFPTKYVNLGYSLEQMNLPVTVLNPFSLEEEVSNRWGVWGPIATFVVGVATGKIGSAILDIVKRSSVWKRLRTNIRRGRDNY